MRADFQTSFALSVRRLSVFLCSTLAASCFGPRLAVTRPEYPRQISTLTLVGQFSIPALQRIPPQLGLVFGGISGLSPEPGGGGLFGVSDANVGGRVYRLSVQGLGGDLRVTPTDFIALEA